MIRKKDVLKQNQIGTPVLIFMASYNNSIPASFPHPSIKVLRIFQKLHPMLFKHGDEWSIDKHRKRLMDWLSSYTATTVS